MVVCGDFIEYLDKDTSVKILMSLEDPFDLAKASAVSRSWRRFVIENSICKKFCQKIFPELRNVVGIVESSHERDMLHYSPTSLETQETDHKAYSSLGCGLTSSETSQDCIQVAMCASSTDNYPEESIQNTLEVSHRTEQRASYWSSKGERDPKVPESLVYKLAANLCVISEIHIQPFQVYFQFGFPIYSAKGVRFHTGLKSHVELENDLESSSSSSTQRFSDDIFVWTYTSPEFPMTQANDVQKFKLPKPILCIGGIPKIELLGRVQRQEMDGLYYICMSHVRAVGRPLGPTFDVEVLDHTGKCTLKYCPQADNFSSKGNRKEETSMFQSIPSRLIHRSVRSWEHMILNALLGNGIVPDFEDPDDVDLIA